MYLYPGLYHFMQYNFDYASYIFIIVIHHPANDIQSDLEQKNSIGIQRRFLVIIALKYSLLFTITDYVLEMERNVILSI